LVETKSGRLSIEIDVDLPLEIIENNPTGVRRWKKVWYAASQKVLYEEGVSFKINKVHFRIV
jgi:hypothetical protein